MKKKGFTLVEFMVSMTLTMIILLFLLRIVIMLKDMYLNSGIKTELLVKQSIISSEINEKFDKNVIAAYQYSDSLYWFFYNDGTNEKLEIDKTNRKLTFGKYTVSLMDGASFGNIDIKTQTVEGVAQNKNNSFMKIHIPIVHSLVKGDYGITVVYQYDNRVTALGPFVSTQTENTSTIFMLKGDITINLENNEPFVEQGYYFINEYGNLQDENGTESSIYYVSGPSETELSCISEATTNATCNLNYTLYKNELSLSSKTRTVNITFTETTE